jgi:hypothetical protein
LLHHADVERLFTLASDIVEVHAGGQLICTTHEHLFYVAGHGWKPARELQFGDLLVGHNGIQTLVEAVVLTDQKVLSFKVRTLDLE